MCRSRPARRCAPRLNQACRCADEPWVNESGFDAPPALLLQPVVADGLAARIASSMSPGSSSSNTRVRPDAGVAVGLQLEPHRQRVRAVGVVAPQLVDLALVPSRCCTWWPTSCAIT